MKDVLFLRRGAITVITANYFNNRAAVGKALAGLLLPFSTLWRYFFIFPWMQQFLVMDTVRFFPFLQLPLPVRPLVQTMHDMKNVMYFHDTRTAVLRTVVEPPALCSCCDQCFFRCPGSWASSYLSGLGAPTLTPSPTLRVLVYLPPQLSLSSHCFSVLIHSYLLFPPLLPSAQSLLRCHPAGIGRHTALNIPESVSEEARSLLEQVRLKCCCCCCCC